MNYKEIRLQIKSGDLLSFNHGSWNTISGIKTEIVHMATRSTYSHVGIAWVIANRVFVLEAVEPCLRIFPLSLEGDFYWTPLNASWHPETEEYALSKLGINYSEIQAMQAFYEELPPDSVQQCAAYAREILLKDGINLGSRSTPDAVVLAAQTLGNPTYYIQNERNI